MLLAFLAYEPLGIFLRSFRSVAYRNQKPAYHSSKFVAGRLCFLAVFYRQTSELVWVIMPLLTLAALEFSRVFNIFSEERLEVGVVSGALLLLLVYIWLDVAKIAIDPYSQFGATTALLFGRHVQLRLRRIGFWRGRRLLSFYVLRSWHLVGPVAPPGLERSGPLQSSLACIALPRLGCKRITQPNGVELWTPDPRPLQAGLLLASVNDISEFSLGHAQSQSVTIMGINSPALEWLLQNHEVEVV